MRDNNQNVFRGDRKLSIIQISDVRMSIVDHSISRVGQETKYIRKASAASRSHHVFTQLAKVIRRLRATTLPLRDLNCVKYFSLLRQFFFSRTNQSYGNQLLSYAVDGGRRLISDCRIQLRFSLRTATKGNSFLYLVSRMERVRYFHAEEGNRQGLSFFINNCTVRHLLICSDRPSRQRTIFNEGCSA